jgi:pimeloyl-ACP methyl ester carboxylesterase
VRRPASLAPLPIFAAILLPFACTQPSIAQDEQAVQWTSGNATLSGTLHLPEGEGPFPAAVFVPGSGNVARTDALPRALAGALTESGYAVLTYDKRGVGQSTGSWREQSLSDLADDVRGALSLLRADPRIEASRIGLIGHSQGGWIAPLSARDEDLAFVVLVASTPLTPLEQSVFVAEGDLRNRGLAGSELEEALALLRRIFEVYATDSGWEETRAAIDAARGEAWFDDELFALQEADSWNWRWLHGLPFAFDVTPVLREMDAPLLTINGGADELVPGDRSRDLFESIRREAGKPVTAVVMPDLDHRMSQSNERVPAEPYWTALTHWLRENDEGPR